MLWVPAATGILQSSSDSLPGIPSLTAASTAAPATGLTRGTFAPNCENVLFFHGTDMGKLVRVHKRKGRKRRHTKGHKTKCLCCVLPRIWITFPPSFLLFRISNSVDAGMLSPLLTIGFGISPFSTLWQVQYFAWQLGTYMKQSCIRGNSQTAWTTQNKTIHGRTRKWHTC